MTAPSSFDGSRPTVIAGRLALQARALTPFLRILLDSPYALRRDEPGVMDFMWGNPHEPAPEEFAAALQRWSVPRTPDWFAYRTSEPRAASAAAQALTRRLGVSVAPEDVILTRGAAGGLAAALTVLTDPGDEVVYLSPPWFFYEAMILAAGAVPVRVRIDPVTFDIDLEALAAAITARTRAVIVNTPNNPTGRIYQPDTLQRLAALLQDASERHGRPVFVISDESYSRIVFDRRDFHSPGRFHPWSLLVHTTSKSTLAPGQRLGYVALPSTLPQREELRDALQLTLFVQGIAVPDAVMQYALPDLEGVLIDIGHLERKRDRMLEALHEQGYRVHAPEATFYLLPQSPLEDDWAFADLLAQRDVFVLPGTAVEMPGYFRISLTASDEMIDKALPVFADARRQVRGRSTTG